MREIFGEDVVFEEAEKAFIPLELKGSLLYLRLVITFPFSLVRCP